MRLWSGGGTNIQLIAETFFGKLLDNFPILYCEVARIVQQTALCILGAMLGASGYRTVASGSRSTLVRLAPAVLLCT